MTETPRRLHTRDRAISQMMGPMGFYRVANLAYRLKLPIFPEIIRLLGVWIYGCDISYKAIIGKNVSLPHYGLATVIGKRVRIADECVIMPGVLLGATLRNQEMPTLRAAVVVGAGAKVLGAVHVGEGAVIAANSVVTSDVPAYSLVGGNPARVIREIITIDDFLV